MHEVKGPLGYLGLLLFISAMNKITILRDTAKQFRLEI